MLPFVTVKTLPYTYELMYVVCNHTVSMSLGRTALWWPSKAKPLCSVYVSFTYTYGGISREAPFQRIAVLILHVQLTPKIFVPPRISLFDVSSFHSRDCLRVKWLQEVINGGKKWHTISRATKLPFWVLSRKNGKTDPWDEQIIRAPVRSSSKAIFCLPGALLLFLKLVALK